MKQYLELLEDIMENGVNRPDRTGTGTRSVFGRQMRFNLLNGFPAVTTKKLAWKAMVSELLWFIEGSGDEKRLREILHGDRDAEKGTIWTANGEADYWKPKAKHEGDLGRIYGVQWRDWRHNEVVGFSEEVQHIDGAVTYLGAKVKSKTVDQLQVLIDGLKNDPYGRRHLLTAWNVGELDQMALPPCHTFAQFYVSPLSQNDINKIYMNYRRSIPIEDRNRLVDTRKDGTSREEVRKSIEDLKELGLPTQKLSCQLYQRSNDVFLGNPFNIASYALFTHMIAQVCGYSVGDLVHTLGDAHIYNDHFDAVAEQVKREPFPLPKLWINPEINTIDGFTMEDFRLVDYQHHATIKAKMAV